MIPAIVKILITCVNIYRIHGRALRADESLNVRFKSLYRSQIEEMSV